MRMVLRAAREAGCTDRCRRSTLTRERTRMPIVTCRSLHTSHVTHVTQYAAEVLRARHIVVRGDSELVVRQMTGQYK